MASTTGIQPIKDYSSGGSNAIRVVMLLSLIPNPDTTSTSGAQAASNDGVNGSTNSYLDEMSPAAATQLRVELTALKNAVTG